MIGPFLDAFLTDANDAVLDFYISYLYHVLKDTFIKTSSALPCWKDRHYANIAQSIKLYEAELKAAVYSVGKLL